MLSFLAAGLATAEGLDRLGSRPRTVGGPLERGLGPVYPSLRAVSELALPGGQPSDAGVGVYPALSAPGALTFPRPPAIEAARRYAAGRRGLVSFAVADARGRVAGLDVDRPYASASLVKAMMLVAYLDWLSREARPLSPADNFRLTYMIRVSDNFSADQVFRRLGPEPLLALARRAGMRSFSVGSDWGAARLTAADQARFFLALNRLLPSRYRAYGRYLLANVARFHRWGIPSAARGRWRVLFKGGWRPDQTGELVHQGALLERGARRMAIVVLTQDSPSELYGRESVHGVALRLLGGAPAASAPAEPNGLVPLRAIERYRDAGPKPLRPLAGAAP